MRPDLVSHLALVRDPRSEKNKLYPLEEILLLCTCAVVSGAEGWQGIVEFGHAKLGWLRQFLPFTNAIPSADCLGWVMARLPAPAFRACFMEWIRGWLPRSCSPALTTRGGKPSEGDRAINGLGLSQCGSLLHPFVW